MKNPQLNNQRGRPLHGRRLGVEPLEARYLLATVGFGVIGDYGADGPNEQAVAELVKSLNPDFVLTLGDNNYDNGAAATIDANVGKHYQEFIGNYTGGFGQGSVTNRFFPTLGNHDWNAAGAQPYLDYFDLPGAGFTNTSGNERYYDFVQGPVHFFALDSDVNEPDGNTSNSTQAQWLEQQLAASTSAYQVVYLHHAPYSSSQHGSDATFQWPFQQWGADVVLAGHDHVYERIDVDGLPYFVNGLGGRSLYDFNTPVAGSQVRFNGNYGALFITADESSMTVAFHSVTDGGTLVDSFTIVAAIDTISPTASLATPLDNGVRDVDPTVDVVTTGFTHATFDIQLSDAQTGIDDTSVSSGSVTVTRDSVTLIEGVDYSFSYDAAGDLITLTASQSFDEATYQILVAGVQDESANPIAPTTLDLVIDRAQATSFTFAMLPDTQFYSESSPASFNAQTQWVADHITSDNLVFVTHVGDVVQNGGQGANQNQVEWGRANTAMSILDGNLVVDPDGLIPYAVAPGNHDYDTVSTHGGGTRFVEFFGASRYDGRSWYFGSSADQLNHYQVFDAGGFQILNITLEWEPRDTALAWAQGVIDAHADLLVVLSTHAYLDESGNRFTTLRTSDGNSGEDIFQQLVRPNPQVFMVLNGHFSGEAHQVSTNDFGQDVIEILADYQDRSNGGDGWMQFLEFLPNENRIDVKTYSPTLDQFETDANSQFSFDINFAERFGLTFPPTASLSNPLDNGPDDLDSAAETVTVSTTQTDFRIQLDDPNDGVDDATVVDSTVALTLDSVPLVQSVDYSLSYDAAGDSGDPNSCFCNTHPTPGLQTTVASCCCCQLAWDCLWQHSPLLELMPIFCWSGIVLRSTTFHLFCCDLKEGIYI